VATVRRDHKPVLPLTDETFINLCKRPEHYTLELGPEDVTAIWSLLEERFGSYVLSEEHRRQPLRYLSLGMARWFRNLPRFSQTTQKHLSEDAHRFRRLIQKAIEEPAPVLFGKLPSLLKNGCCPSETTGGHSNVIATRLNDLVGEFEAAYPDLLWRLDRRVATLFSSETEANQEGRSAMTSWVTNVEDQCGRDLSELRFGDVRAEALVQTIKSDIQGSMFWDELARGMTGLPPRDWNDHSEEDFYEVLGKARAEVEREALGLATETEGIVEINLCLGKEERVSYRFRQADLSEQGRRLLQHFKTTMKVSGRPLSADERRQVIVALLQYVMEEKGE
jgi:hypothetical protein